MKIYSVLLILLISSTTFAIDTSFQLKNSAYIYNGENGSHWEETRTTITYLEDVVEPGFKFDMGNISFEVGAGLLFPFNQEEKMIAYYPVIRSTVQFGHWQLMLGTLKGEHDLPDTILDPLISLTPQVRIISSNRVPLPYESFPLGLFSHGRYEYGLSLRLDSTLGGELYVNWQLQDSTNHRERFDMGLILKTQTTFIPWYSALHYWHNGGHENPHPVAITENYNLGLGIKNEKYSFLYLMSYWIPDRENNPQLNKTGHALYGRYLQPIGRGHWSLEGELFASTELINSNQQYIAIEADPFYQMPLYLGINAHYKWLISPEFTMTMSFKNGVFWAGPIEPWNNLMIRYDQMIRIDFNTQFDMNRSKQSKQDQNYTAFNNQEN